MRFVPVLGNRCCQTLSGVVVCRSLAISTEQIHATTTTELCRPALRTLLQIGDEGLAVPDNRGSERWRPTCVHWVLAWRQQSDARRTERHGGDLWQRQRRPWQALKKRYDSDKHRLCIYTTPRQGYPPYRYTICAATRKLCSLHVDEQAYKLHNTFTNSGRWYARSRLRTFTAHSAHDRPTLYIVIGGTTWSKLSDVRAFHKSIVELSSQSPVQQ